MHAALQMSAEANALGVQPAFDTSQPTAFLMRLLRESTDRSAPAESKLLVLVLRDLLRDLSHQQVSPFSCPLWHYTIVYTNLL